MSPEPDDLLRWAERIAHEMGGRPADTADPPWVALPLRCDLPPSPAERSAAIERVLAWARSGGASWDGIEFVVDAHGNAAVRARRMIGSGTAILSLPRRLMLVDNAVTTSGLRPRDALAAWLPLEQRDSASPWRAYLDALPVQLAELPMFHVDLDALAGTAAHALAAADNRDVQSSYDGLSSELRARLSLADFAWGCAIVKSRGFHAPGSVEHRLALLPVVELFNHRLGDTTWSYNPLDERFVVTTERAFAIGDEVHFTYGDRSNTRLLVHFGFAAPENPTREAGLLFERPSDPVNEVAANLLWSLPLGSAPRLPIASTLDHRFLRALSLARLQASGATERARALEAGLSPQGDLPWLGGAHETAAFGVIAAAAERGLATLQAGAPHTATTAWERTCAIVRDAERAVLEEILELTSAVREYLPWNDATRLRAVADDLSVAAVGARRLLRQYLRALADELAG
ncbi:hypothetical protein BH11MYX3_BH11MYX3_26100 [soil metagenome]